MEEGKTKAGLRSLYSGLSLGLLSDFFPWPHARAGGVRFFFSPRRLQRGFDPYFVERFVALYAVWTPATYKYFGYRVSSDDLRSHISKLRCDVIGGYLTNGRGDDSLLGAVQTETSIKISVIDHMVVNSMLHISKTAFAQEVHNACVWKFAGQDVMTGSRGSGLVRLSKLTDEQIRERKSALDASFLAVKNEVRVI
jgi:hypothetical protein